MDGTVNLIWVVKLENFRIMHRVVIMTFSSLQASVAGNNEQNETTLSKILHAFLCIQDVK